MGAVARDSGPKALSGIRRLLCISAEESLFRVRRFLPGDAAKQQRMESVGQTFICGYNAALESGTPADVAGRLNSVELESRGFAFEGAAMALTLLDELAFRRTSRFRVFLDGPGQAHAYMLHVGAGWAYARLPWLKWRIRGSIQRLDPLLRWLAVDGFGFHEGYFHWPRVGERRQIPIGLQGYARRAFDQGLGRVLWFVMCADPARVSRAIAGFPESRRPDLWSGIGLACTYAGGCDTGELEELCDRSGGSRRALAQGAAFAAKTRQRAGNLVPHTEEACGVICGLSAADAAAVTDNALQRLPGDGDIPAFEIWRQRIQREFVRNNEVKAWTA